jgi:hypothetical protein
MTASSVAKVTISLPADLLRAVDARAESEGTKRSPWIAVALAAALSEGTPPLSPVGSDRAEVKPSVGGGGRDAAPGGRSAPQRAARVGRGRKAAEGKVPDLPKIAPKHWAS